MTETTPASMAVARKLADVAERAVWDVENVLIAVKAPPALSAVVLEELGRRAFATAQRYREKTR